MHYKNILQIKLGLFTPLHRSPSPMFPASLYISVCGLVCLFITNEGRRERFVRYCTLAVSGVNNILEEKKQPEM